MADKIRAQVTSSPGVRSISSRIHWQSTVSTTPISSDDAEEAQARAGYHPLGYGFFGFVCKEVEGGYQATWNCAGSCD